MRATNHGIIQIPKENHYLHIEMFFSAPKFETCGNVRFSCKVGLNKLVHIEINRHITNTLKGQVCENVSLILPIWSRN